ncbi:MAG TPA: uroporphyrinogen decarboxylase [Verrucomicrobiae bacterium]|jgi:uroporphyrinogen decarboxylase|nr:uroporphyrinogen decarboxylase [Verrucomicrobiae bacterium]
MTQSNESVDRKALFLRACRCEPVERVPVWIMRQAGRYLPEYRAVRAKHNFLEVCTTPELAIEVSLQPYRILGVEAVIVFSDILIPAGAMGLPFELSDKGPVIESPLRTAAQIRELALFDPERDTRFLMDAIRGLVRELGPGVPVLGFAAAPWTLACYMIEGHHKDGFPAAKTLLYSDPALFRSLLERIARATARYLRAQIAAGAAAVQLFDTWVGELTLDQYREFALPATQLLIEEIGAGDTPVILYTKASSHLLTAAAESGASVLSVDWRVDLASLREQIGPRIALQGNVDPCVLLGPEEGVRRAAREAVESTGGIGHILNLGHGILQQTPVENARAFVEAGQGTAVADRVRVERAR